MMDVMKTLESSGAVAAPEASEKDELGRHVLLQTNRQPQLTQQTSCAKSTSEQRRADAVNAQEFHQIQQFVGECRRQWPGAMIVLRPDGAPIGANMQEN